MSRAKKKPKGDLGRPGRLDPGGFATGELPASAGYPEDRRDEPMTTAGKVFFYAIVLLLVAGIVVIWLLSRYVG